jgi:DNA-binding MarR family transcriptional regulator
LASARRTELLEKTATDVRRSVSRVNRLLARSLPRGGLTQAKLSALASLQRDGSMAARGLSDRMTIRPQSLTRVLSDLEAEGLITRMRALEDGREHVLSITPKGSELMRQEGLRRDALIRNVMQHALSRTEIEVLAIAARVLDRVADMWSVFAPTSANDEPLRPIADQRE